MPVRPPPTPPHTRPPKTKQNNQLGTLLADVATRRTEVAQLSELNASLRRRAAALELALAGRDAHLAALKAAARARAGAGSGSASPAAGGAPRAAPFDNVEEGEAEADAVDMQEGPEAEAAAVSAAAAETAAAVATAAAMSDLGRARARSASAPVSPAASMMREQQQAIALAVARLRSADLALSTGCNPGAAAPGSPLAISARSFSAEITTSASGAVASSYGGLTATGAAAQPFGPAAQQQQLRLAQQGQLLQEDAPAPKGFVGYCVTTEGSALIRAASSGGLG
jgi:hypothetical protein